jgi:membrane-anchored mycosin MYCP
MGGTLIGRASGFLTVAVSIAFAVPLVTLDGRTDADRRIAAPAAVSAAVGPASSVGSFVASTPWQQAAAHLPGPLVAVIDTGVAPTPDLVGRLEPGQSFVGGLATADESGHGTAVAGIVAGASGVCPTCRILPLRVSAGAGGTAASEDIAAAVDAAVARGAAVVNLSMVATSPTESERAAVARAVAADVVVVGAVGNSASSTPTYPASYPGVLSVGAVGEGGAIAAFSNRGPWVSVLAPGCGRSHSPDGGELQFCGTSAAAPYVAGVVAVLRSAVPTATASAVLAAVRGSSHAADGAANGIVDPEGALSMIGGLPSLPPVRATVVKKAVKKPSTKPVATKPAKQRARNVAKATRKVARPARRSAHVVRPPGGPR